MLIYACNFSTQKAKTGVSPKFKANLVYFVSSSPSRLGTFYLEHSNILSQKQQKPHIVIA